MKAVAAILVVALAAPAAAQTNPIQKTLQLLSDLETKILGEGKASHKVFADFSEFCEDRSRELHFEIKTENTQIANLKAVIAEETVTMSSLTTRIEELAAEIATDEADLKAANHIRAVELASFLAEEKELMEIVDTLGRAIGIIQREMAKGGASMLQLKSASSVAQALSIFRELQNRRGEAMSQLTVADAHVLLEEGGEAARAALPRTK